MKSILFTLDTSVVGPIRAGIPGAALQAKGYRVGIALFGTIGEKAYAEADVVCFVRPTYNAAAAIQFMRQWPNKRAFVNVDDHFEAIPKGHPGYDLIGPGNPERIGYLHAAIRACDRLLVSTPELAERYAGYHKPVEIVPNGWLSSNDVWQRKWPHRGVTIGWAGTATHTEDWNLIETPVRRILKEFPDTRLVIAGDERIYARFASTPEKQKLYLPGLEYSQYPWLIAHFDILLAPLADTYFNRAKSDIKLVDAGARGIPFIASRLEPYLHWPAGCGLLASTPAEWYDALKLLVTDPAQRGMMGYAGSLAAAGRDGLNTSQWEKLLEEA